MRPLTVASECPEDNNIIPITPCHLIIGNAIKPLPSEIYSHEEKEKKITKDLKKRDGRIENKFFITIGIYGEKNISPLCAD